MDFSDVSFFYKEKINKDLEVTINVISKILEKYEKNKKIIYFDDWFLQHFDKEQMYIPQSIIRAIIFSDSSKTLTDYGVYILSTFFDDCFTFKNGLEELVYSLSKNCTIENHIVNKMQFKNNRLIAIKTNNRTIDTTQDIVISTAPPPDIKIENHELLRKIFVKIQFNGCAVVIYRVKKIFQEKPNYIFFPEKKYKISVIEQMNIDNNYFIGCLIPHMAKIEKDRVLSYSKQIMRKVLNRNFEENIIETHYYDWPNGLPLVNENYIRIIDKLKRIRFNNLLFAGDYTTTNPSMDSAIKSGFDVQQKLEKIRL